MVVDRLKVAIDYFIYYYPTISFIPTLVEGHSLFGVSVGGIFLVLFLFVLAVRVMCKTL